MPTIEIVLTEKQREYVEEIAAVTGKKMQPPIELSPERWCFRSLRQVAQNANAIWHNAERDGKAEVLDPTKKAGSQVVITYKFSELEHWMKDYIYVPPKVAKGEESIRLVFPQALFDALRHAALLDALSMDARGEKRNWKDFNGWIDDLLDRRIVEGKIWADSVAWEEEETEAFKAKPGKVK